MMEAQIGRRLYKMSEEISSVEIAQDFIDGVEDLYGDLDNDDSIANINDKIDFKRYLGAVYDRDFEQEEVDELHRVVLDLFNDEVKAERVPQAGDNDYPKGEFTWMD
jgi:hypothetical protein